MRYDHYISLGRNCEPAFQFRRVLQEDRSGFFSWNVTEFNSLISILDSDFSNVVQPGNLIYEGNGNLVRDKSHDYHFHWVDADLSEIHGETESLKAHQSKALYLIKKFKTVLSSTESKVLFYTTEESEVRERAEKVASLLREKFQARNFKLVVLQPMTRREDDWGVPSIANRYLDRFAPWADATDGHVRSWDAVFREFPHRDPMHLAGF